MDKRFRSEYTKTRHSKTKHTFFSGWATPVPDPSLSGGSKVYLQHSQRQSRQTVHIDCGSPGKATVEHSSSGIQLEVAQNASMLQLPHPRLQMTLNISPARFRLHHNPRILQRLKDREESDVVQ